MDAMVKLREARNSAERFGAQRRVNAIKRDMVSRGMDTTTTRRAPAPAPKPAVAPKPAAPKPGARAATFQEQMRERMETERELGIQRGRAKPDTTKQGRS